jgi:hypothetical protein
MSYTLGQAARAVGKSKPTIARAIQTGRLSASRTDSGTFVIDPAELHRVFQVAGNGAGTMKQTVPGEPDGTSQAALRVERDRLLIEREDLRETIRDLRQRLDAESEERRRAQERLTALLTHRQAGSVPAVNSPTLTGPRRPWWRRWFR